MADEHETTGQPETGDETTGTPNDGGGQDLGDAGKKALAEERAARREAEKQRKELEAQLKELQPLAAKAKQLEDAKKSEAEKLNEKLTSAEKRAADAEQRLLRAEVAAEKGLSAAQAKRLVGATREELEADADDLLTVFGSSSKDGDTSKGGKGRTSPDRLRPGGMPNPKEPSLAERIAEAEKAKDWATAQQLKAQQLMQMANPPN